MWWDGSGGGAGLLGPGLSARRIPRLLIRLRLGWGQMSSGGGAQDGGLVGWIGI